MAQPSLIVVPARFKAGTLYAYSPLQTAPVSFGVTRGTTARRFNSAGLIESVASGVPRLDYGVGACPGLLVEPAATNLLQRSEEFDNASWFKARINAFGSGSIANATTAPDGTMTADYIQQQTGETNSGGVFDLFTTVSGTIYTFSVFAKKSDSNFLRLGAGWITAGDFAEFNLDTGTIGTVASGLTARMVDFGNGWYRCSITGTAAVSDSRAHFIYQNSSPTAVPDTGIFIWGAQLETGSVATSYIPTTSATATRNADVISLTNASGFIGQSEGTVYAEVDYSIFTSGARALVVKPSGADTNNFIQIEKGSTLNTLRCRVQINGTLVLDNTVAINLGVNKVAIAYNSGNTISCFNGQLQTLSTTAFSPPPSLSEINLGHTTTFGSSLVHFYDRINAAAIYPTRLSNDELAQLTTL